MNRIFILTPLIVLLIICIFSLVYLLSGKDPNKPPSALLNKDIPIFESSSLYNAKDIIKTKDEPPPTYKIPATNIIMLIMQLMALKDGVSMSLSSASRLDNKSEDRDVTFPER